MNQKPLEEYIGRTPLRWDGTIRDGFQRTGEPYEPNRHNFIGIEIEVEGISNDHYTEWLHQAPSWFEIHSDGSLRNGGAEFITYPFDGRYASSVLKYFFTSLERTNPGFTFTNRCSIHVHLDMTDTTYWQFESLYQLYLCFERQFYNYAGDVRENSNFCVPVSETPFEEYLFSSARSRTWSSLLNTIPGLDAAKYTGLNITRLRDIGTVEFRHLPGHKRVPFITKFIHFILCLKQFAINNTREQVNSLIMNANTISNYQMFAEGVFGEHTNALFPTGEFNLIEEGITTAKRIYFDRTNVAKEEPLRKLFKSPTLMEKISKVMEEAEGAQVPETPRPAGRTRTARAVQELVGNNPGIFQWDAVQVGNR